MLEFAREPQRLCFFFFLGIRHSIVMTYDIPFEMESEREQLSFKLKMAMEDDGLTTSQREQLAEAFMSRDCLTSKLLDSRKANELSNRLNEKAAYDKSRPVKKLPFYVDGEDYNRLQLNFPQFTVVQHGTTRNAHAYCANSRMLEGEVLIAHAWPKRGGLSKRMLDVGGNLVCHIRFERPNIHTCCPRLDVRDGARYTEREMNLIDYLENDKKGKNAAMPGSALAKFYNEMKDFTENGVAPTMWCNKNSQNCTVQATTGISLHSCYDIPFDDWGKIMYRHGCKKLYGCFHFWPGILDPYGADSEVPAQTAGCILRKFSKSAGQNDQRYVSLSTTT